MQLDQPIKVKLEYYSVCVSASLYMTIIMQTQTMRSIMPPRTRNQRFAKEELKTGRHATNASRTDNLLLKEDH